MTDLYVLCADVAGMQAATMHLLNIRYAQDKVHNHTASFQPEAATCAGSRSHTYTVVI